MAETERLLKALMAMDAALESTLDPKATCDHDAGVCWCEYARIRGLMGDAIEAQDPYIVFNGLGHVDYANARRDNDGCWTPIPMAPGYAATPDGRIFSIASNWRGYGERELSQSPNGAGYPRVRLLIGGKRKSIPVHRLIANTFLPPRPSCDHQLRHLDGNRLNCSAANLAWGTAKDNADDRGRHGTTYRGAWDTPEKREKMTAAIRAGFARKRLEKQGLVS